MFETFWLWNSGCYTVASHGESCQISIAKNVQKKKQIGKINLKKKKWIEINERWRVVGRCWGLLLL